MQKYIFVPTAIPCPCCDAIDELVWHLEKDKVKTVCERCGISGPPAEMPEDADYAWNEWAKEERWHLHP